MAKQPKPEKGVEVRFNADGVASYRGHVWLAADKKLQRGPWFPTITQARNWRTDNLATGSRR